MAPHRGSSRQDTAEEEAPGEGGLGQCGPRTVLGNTGINRGPAQTSAVTGPPPLTPARDCPVHST